MEYTDDDFLLAPTMDISHYLLLLNPVFEGQTKVDEYGNYKIYFSDSGYLYGYKNNIYK